MYKWIPLCVILVLEFFFISCSTNSLDGKYYIDEIKEFTANGIAEYDEDSRIGMMVEISGNLVKINNFNYKIRKIEVNHYTEKEFMKMTGGSGQRPLSFSDINYHGEVLDEYWIRYDYHIFDGQQLLQQKVLSSIFLLKNNRYLIFGDYMYFCHKK